MDIAHRPRRTRILRSPTLWAVLLFVGAISFLFAPVFRGEVPLPTRSIAGLTWGAPDQPAQTSWFRDRIVQSYPYNLFAAQEIQQGRFPLWNNLIFAGTPFYANGQAGVLSPFKLPFWWLPSWLSFVIVTLLQGIVGGLGMYTLGRRLGWRPAASAVAGLALALSAPFVMRLTVTTMSAVIACLPWILWSILRLHERLTWRSMSLVSVLLALAVYAGHVQLAAFALGYAAFWTLLWWRKTFTRRRLMLFSLAFVFGLGLAAVQLLPVKEALDQAYRQPAHRTWSQVLNPKRIFAVNIKQAAGLATLVDQNALGDEAHYRGPANYLEGNLYLGPLALLGVLLSVGAWRQRWWRGLAVLAVLQGGLFVFPGWWDLIGQVAPWITVTPVWRTSFFFVFTLSLLAGLGVQVMLTKRSVHLGWGVVGVMVVVSLWQWQGILPFAPRSTLFPPDPLLTRAVAETRDGSRLWTPNGTLDQFMSYHLPVVMGYDSVYPKSYLDLWSANAELRQRNQLHVKDPNAQVLAASGANLMLTKDALPGGWTEIAASGAWRLAKLEHATSPIHAVQQVVAETSPAQLSSIDVATTALVANGSPDIDPNANAQVTITARTPTSLQLTVDSHGSTVIVTNLQSYPGWRLSIDGHDTAAAHLNVNHAFQGAAVSSGQHTLEFRYRPRSLMIGIAISILTLLMIAGGWWWPAKRKTVPLAQ